jgi:hypothetical protein
MDGRVLVVPLDSVLVWAEAYGAIALLVWVGFMLQRFAWGEPEGKPGFPRVVRVIVAGFIVGALWPLWVLIAVVGAAFAGAASW